MGMKRDPLLVTAAVGTIAQLLFAGLEIFGWSDRFVATAAPKWIGYQKLGDLSTEMRAKIDWAENLADNMGTYNLVLAIGLAWVAYERHKSLQGNIPTGEDVRTLAVFLAVWLLVAAVAAGLTAVYGALALQGALGLALLYAALDHSRDTAPALVHPS
jgi:uncharacterized membrane protein